MSRADAAELAFHLWPLLLPVCAVAGFGVFAVAQFVAERSDAGFVARASRGVVRALGAVARGSLILLGATICAASVFFLCRTRWLGPSGAFDLSGDRRFLLVPLGLVFGAPVFFFAGGILGESLERRRRRRLAGVFAEAAQGTYLTVVPVDYPLLEFGRDPRRGLEFLPEPLRGARLFADFSGRVEGVLCGPLMGVELAVCDYWYWTQGFGRSGGSKHALTLVGLRGPGPAAGLAFAPARAAFAARILQALGGDWKPLATVDESARLIDSRYSASGGEALEKELASLDRELDELQGLEREGPSSAPAKADPPAFFGDWLLLGHEGPLTEAEDLRALLAALAAGLGPSRA